jgi:hypothetical protein
MGILYGEGRSSATGSEALACAAVRTEEPEVVERLVVRAGEYLDQAAVLEAAPAG